MFLINFVAYYMVLRTVFTASSLLLRRGPALALARCTLRRDHSATALTCYVMNVLLPRKQGAEKRKQGTEKRSQGAEKRSQGVEKRSQGA